MSDAVKTACDALDGLKDGMIFALGQCITARVRPELDRLTCRGGKAERCLLSVQVATLLHVLDGARDGRLLYATWAWDAGIGGTAASGYFHGWRNWKIGHAAGSTNDARNITLAAGTVSAAFTAPPTPLPDDPVAYTRWAMDIDVEATEAASRVKRGPRNEAGVDFMNAEATDLAAFTAHGGKLLIYHGASDPVFSINATIDQADFFSALVAWTEHGVAPNSLVATARAGIQWPGRTRPLCAYPQAAHHVAGHSEKASSFRCQ